MHYGCRGDVLRPCPVGRPCALRRPRSSFRPARSCTSPRVREGWATTSRTRRTSRFGLLAVSSKRFPDVVAYPERESPGWPTRHPDARRLKAATRESSPASTYRPRMKSASPARHQSRSRVKPAGSARARNPLTEAPTRRRGPHGGNMVSHVITWFPHDHLGGLGIARLGAAHPRRRRGDRGRAHRRGGTERRPRAGNAGTRTRPSSPASSTRTRISNTRSTPALATGCLSAIGSACTSSARRESTSRRWRTLRGWGRSSACALRASRPSGTAASAGRRRRPAPTSVSGARSISRCSARGAAAVVERFEPMHERIAGTLSDSIRLGVSPHAPYTCSLELYGACDELDLPVATHLAESEDENEFLRTGGGGWEAFADMLVEPLGTTGIRALAGAGLLGRHVLAAHCVMADEDEIALLARARRRRRTLPSLECAAGPGNCSVADLVAAGVRVGSAPTAPLPRPRPTSSRSCGRGSPWPGCGTAARVRCRPMASSSSRPWLGVGGRAGRRARSLEPGRQADLAVVSLEGSPYVPGRIRPPPSSWAAPRRGYC